MNQEVNRDEKGRFLKGHKISSPGKLGHRAYDISKIDLDRFYVKERQSMEEIGKRYGCSTRTVKRRLNDYGISVRTSGESLRGKITARRGRFEIPLPSKEDLERLYIDEKLSCSEIAKRYKCSASITRYRLKYLGIPRRDRSLATSLAVSGEKNNKWKGGITAIHNKLRNNFKYRLWRSDVFHRDNFTCQDCGKRGKGTLHAHHLKSFSKILKEYDIKTYSEGLECEEFWDINNGTTLCEKCHRLRHTLTN